MFGDPLRGTACRARSRKRSLRVDEGANVSEKLEVNADNASRIPSFSAGLVPASESESRLTQHVPVFGEEHSASMLRLHLSALPATRPSTTLLLPSSDWRTRIRVVDSASHDVARGEGRAKGFARAEAAEGSAVVAVVAP